MMISIDNFLYAMVHIYLLISIIVIGIGVGLPKSRSSADEQFFSKVEAYVRAGRIFYEAV